MIRIRDRQTNKTNQREEDAKKRTNTERQHFYCPYFPFLCSIEERNKRASVREREQWANKYPRTCIFMYYMVYILHLDYVFAPFV